MPILPVPLLEHLYASEEAHMLVRFPKIRASSKQIPVRYLILSIIMASLWLSACGVYWYPQFQLDFADGVDGRGEQNKAEL